MNIMLISQKVNDWCEYLEMCCRTSLFEVIVFELLLR